MADFDPTWRSHRVNAGTELLVKLVRTGGIIDSPEEDQVREQLGADARVAAGIGSCAGGFFGAGCPEYHVPVTVLESAVLSDVLPSDVVVKSGGLFGVPVATGSQTWEVQGVAFQGIAGRQQQESARERQERNPEGGGLLSEIPWAPVLLIVAVAFAFTGAGQQIVGNITETVEGGDG